jgi:hypothetical protein
MSSQSVFRVGQMNVDIVDSTEDIYVNSTNKYILTIESDWAGSITDVYARITTPDGKSLKTPNVDMISPGGGRKAAAQIETYWETGGLAIGTYNLTITLYYKGLTSNKNVNVNIIEGKAPELEKPKNANSKLGYIIAISIAIAIIVFTGVYFLVFKKGNEPKPKSADDIDIKPPSI